MLVEVPRATAPVGLPVALGVMAAGGGLAAVTSGSGQSLIAFAGVAAIAAGTDTELPAADRGRRGGHPPDLGRRPA